MKKKAEKNNKKKTSEELIEYIEESLDIRKTVMWGNSMYSDKLKYMFVDVFKHFDNKLDEINNKLEKLIN